MSTPNPALARPGVPTHRTLVSGSLNFGALSPILRTLLTTDGTVTEVLSAYFGEEIRVQVLAQGYRAYEGRFNLELEAGVGVRMLDRRITLVGMESGTFYAAADSRIVPGLLPPGMQEALLAEREPLGKLMLDYRLETFREIVAAGACRAGDAPHLKGHCGPALALGDDAIVVWRTYRVISQGQPIMSITEAFSEGLE